MINRPKRECASTRQIPDQNVHEGLCRQRPPSTHRGARPSEPATKHDQRDLYLRWPEEIVRVAAVVPDATGRYGRPTTRTAQGPTGRPVLASNRTCSGSDRMKRAHQGDRAALSCRPYRLLQFRTSNQGATRRTHRSEHRSRRQAPWPVVSRSRRVSVWFGRFRYGQFVARKLLLPRREPHESFASTRELGVAQTRE